MVHLPQAFKSKVTSFRQKPAEVFLTKSLLEVKTHRQSHTHNTIQSVVSLYSHSEYRAICDNMPPNESEFLEDIHSNPQIEQQKDRTKQHFHVRLSERMEPKPYHSPFYYPDDKRARFHESIS